ncbi:MAG: hypothetical protein IJ222_07410 [Bacteroidales bacterium]|nr:hypothetical protein [Bacteroidales bacterium]
MANFFLRQLFRITGSKVPTSLLRWEQLSSVTVLLDADAEDAPQAERMVRELLGSALREIVPVRRKKLIRVRKETQALVSLLPFNDFRSEYVLRRSRAQFKAGRVPLDVLDLVVSDPEGQSFPQTEVFGKMVDIIKNLK